MATPTIATLIRNTNGDGVTFANGQYGVRQNSTNAAPSITDAKCVLQDLDFKRDGKNVIATNEQGFEIGVAIHGGNVIEASGNFLVADVSADIADMTAATAIGATLSGLKACTVVESTTSEFVLYGAGRKQNHEAWSTGDFKAVALIGGTITAGS